MSFSNLKDKIERVIQVTNKVNATATFLTPVT